MTPFLKEKTSLSSPKDRQTCHRNFSFFLRSRPHNSVRKLCNKSLDRKYLTKWYLNKFCVRTACIQGNTQMHNSVQAAPNLQTWAMGRKIKSDESFSLVPSPRNTCWKTKESLNHQCLLPIVWMSIDPLETVKTTRSKYIKPFCHFTRPD